MTEQPTKPRRSVDAITLLTNFMKGKDAMIIQLTNVRLAFAHLFQPVAFESDGEKKYQATLLIPKNTPLAKEVEAAILEVATAAWKDKAKTALQSMRSNPNKFCFQDGDTKSYDGFAGHMALSARNKKRPTLVDRDKKQLTEEDGKPYSGCYVNASVEIWAQDNKWGKGIRASLRGIQFLKHGDAFSSGSIASDDEFQDLGEGAEDDTELA